MSAYPYGVFLSLLSVDEFTTAHAFYNFYGFLLHFWRDKPCSMEGFGYGSFVNSSKVLDSFHYLGVYPPRFEYKELMKSNPS